MASDPPTRAEAWAAVLDNPRLVHRLAESVGGGEDALVDAQIALMEAFPDVTHGNPYTIARWRLMTRHLFSGRLLDPPRGRIEAAKRLDEENERRRNLRLPLMPEEPVDRLSPKGSVSRFLLEGAWRSSLEPEGVDGVFVRIGERPRRIEELAVVWPVEREDLWRTGLYAALRTLSTRERRILRAIVLDGRSGAEVGRELGCSKQRVYQVLKAVLRKLRCQLDGANEEG